MGVRVANIEPFLLFQQCCFLLVKLLDKALAQLLDQSLVLLLGNGNLVAVVLLNLLNSKVVSVL